MSWQGGGNQQQEEEQAEAAAPPESLATPSQPAGDGSLKAQKAAETHEQAETASIVPSSKEDVDMVASGGPAGISEGAMDAVAGDEVAPPALGHKDEVGPAVRDELPTEEPEEVPAEQPVEVPGPAEIPDHLPNNAAAEPVAAVMSAAGDEGQDAAAGAVEEPVEELAAGQPEPDVGGMAEEPAAGAPGAVDAAMPDVSDEAIPHREGTPKVAVQPLEGEPEDDAEVDYEAEEPELAPPTAIPEARPQPRGSHHADKPGRKRGREEAVVKARPEKASRPASDAPSAKAQVDERPAAKPKDAKAGDLGRKGETKERDRDRPRDREREKTRDKTRDRGRDKESGEKRAQAAPLMFGTCAANIRLCWHSLGTSHLCSMVFHPCQIWRKGCIQRLTYGGVSPTSA